MVTLYMTIIIHFIYIYIKHIISSKTRTVTVQCLPRSNKSNQWHFKRKTRFGFPSTTSLVKKTIMILQTLQQWTSLYLFKLIFWRNSSYVTINICKIPFFKTRHTFLKNFFFPPTINEWNRFDHNIWKSSSFNIFRESILKSISPSANSFFNCHNPKRIRFTRRLRLGLSHLQEHEFKPISQDSLNPFCSCGLDIEPTVHYLLNCATYITEHLLPLAPKKILITIS